MSRASLFWFGVFGGTAAWAGHLLLSYLVVGVGCDGVSSALLNVLLLGTTLVAGPAAIGSLFVAWDLASHTAGWRRFLARLGLLLDGLSVAGIAFASLIPLALRPC